MLSLRDSLWLIALAIMGMGWWADHSAMSVQLRSHKAALAAIEEELQAWKMAAERRMLATQAERGQARD